METDRRSGTQLGRYLLHEVLGRGGMGVVYRATAADSSDEFAIKLMVPELSDSPEFRERFLREAEVGPLIDHPNVVPVYGWGDADGELYIAMKKIDGRDLKAVLRDEGALEPRRALRVLRQVASALDAAHELGLIHRDIKPQNILLADRTEASSDLVYVTDFGLVRPMSSETTASRTGQVFGSLQYMAPELIEALTADGRADVYALACVAYEALTGQVPFERPNEVAVVWAHIHEDPPIATHAKKDLPGGVDEVLTRAMAKHPDDRFLTSGEFVDALEEGLGKARSRVVKSTRMLVDRVPRRKTEREVWAPNFFPELSRVRRSQRRINWYKASAFVAFLVFLSSIQFGREGGLQRALNDAATSAGEAGRSVIDTLTGRDETPRKRPKPRLDASVVRVAGRTERLDDPVSRRKRRVVLPRADGTESATQADDVTVPVSPISDDRTIIFHALLTARSGVGQESDAALYAVEPDGSNARVYYDDTPFGDDDYEASYSPDGRQIAFVSGYGLLIHTVATQRARTLPCPLAWCSEPSWSPDGSQLVVSANESEYPAPVDEWSLYVVNVNGTGSRALYDGPGGERSPTWSSDGRWIAFTKVTATDEDVMAVRADGTGLRAIAATDRYEFAPAWSRSGLRLAYARTTERGDASHLWVSSGDGMGRSITSGAVVDAAPVWSPSGEWIAFTRDRGGSAGPEVYKVRSSGLGAPVNISSGQGQAPAW